MQRIAVKASMEQKCNVFPLYDEWTSSGIEVFILHERIVSGSCACMDTNYLIHMQKLFVS